MKRRRPLSRQLAAWIFFFMFLACLAVVGGAYVLVQTAAAKVQLLQQTHPAIDEIDALTQTVDTAGSFFWPYFVPASVVFFGLLALFCWLVLRRAAGREFETRSQPLPARQKPGRSEKTKKPDTADQPQTDAGVQQRLYLHLMAVLQREGRLMDFFSEDLAAYPDAQIGAAVRTIHENCRQTIQKHLAPRSVLEDKEGAAITIAADFDPNAVKLVGNVAGEPPFQGIVRHRGWRAGKINMPTFAGRQDPSILAPAEVEVQ